jgi:hypothetical protein
VKTGLEAQILVIQTEMEKKKKETVLLKLKKANLLLNKEGFRISLEDEYEISGDDRVNEVKDAGNLVAIALY